MSEIDAFQSYHFIQVGHPERDDHPSCAYSQLDFDNDEEFHNFFTKYRLCILESVRLISTTEPLIPLTLVDAWAKEVTSFGLLYCMWSVDNSIPIGAGIPVNCSAGLGSDIEHS